MDASPKPTLGKRVQLARRARAWTQLDLASALGKSETWVRRVETGRHILDRQSHIQALADALGVEPGWLLGQPFHPNNDGDVSIPALRAALRRSSLALGGHTPSPQPPADIAALRTRVAHALTSRQAADLTATAEDLPGLIHDVTGVALGSSAQRDEGLDLMVTVHCMARMITNQLGFPDLAWLAAAVATDAAARLGDPVAAAAAAWDRCGALLHSGDLAETVGVAEHALAALEDAAGVEALSMQGALHLRIAVARSRSRQGSSSAWDHIREADTLAARTGETHTRQTVFGPANVQVHAAEVAVERDEPDKALKRAKLVVPGALQSGERVTSLRISQARAHLARGNAGEAVAVLAKRAHRTPTYVFCHPMARAVVSEVLTTSRATSAGAVAAGLAERMGLLEDAC